MLKKGILYLLITLVSNGTFVSGVAIIFKDRVYIETHLEQGVLIIALTLFLLSIVLISYLLAEIFGSSVMQIILRIITWLWLSIFGLNVFTVIKSIYNILSFKDEIFTCKFFTLYYQYSKKELLSYIDNYYNEISTIWRRLWLWERISILGKNTTIREVNESVEAYCNYEANSWWTKITELLNWSVSYGLAHPWAIGVAGAAIGSLVAYPTYLWIKNTYNVQIVAKTVQTLNGEVLNVAWATSNLVTGLEHVSNTLDSQKTIQSVIIRVLGAYLETQIQVYNLQDDLTVEERGMVSNKLLSLLADLTRIVAPAEVNAIPSNTITIAENNAASSGYTPFSGEGHILGDGGMY